MKIDLTVSHHSSRLCSDATVVPISAFILLVHSDMKTHPKHRELPAALAKTRPAFHKNNLVPHAALDARCSQTIYQRLSDGLAHRRIPQPPGTSHMSFTFIFPCPWNSSKSVCAMRQQTRPAFCPLLLLPPRTCLAAVALSGCRVESGFCRAKKRGSSKWYGFLSPVCAPYIPITFD